MIFELSSRLVVRFRRDYVKINCEKFCKIKLNNISAKKDNHEFTHNKFTISIDDIFAKLSQHQLYKFNIFRSCFIFMNYQD